ncbi:MAG: hypothetical protein F6K58_28110 [Symploca sp. SIO2E9]|nr:hypothetical protein [Symploca sp. SIO2E9]
MGRGGDAETRGGGDGERGRWGEREMGRNYSSGLTFIGELRGVVLHQA